MWNMRDQTVCLLSGLALLCVTGGVAAAASPAQVCQAGKNTASGKYADCRQKAEAKYATSLDGARRAASFTKCEEKLTRSWSILEAKAVAQGGVCPSTGDLVPLELAVARSSGALATSLAGSGPPSVPEARPLKTGQTRCYDASGEIPCGGTGQDGASQVGVARSYRDEGVGTVTDERTGLTWEKLSADGGIHDSEALYTWYGVGSKILLLNNSFFAGHSDWRLPNRFELETLLDLGATSPAAQPSFNVSCVPACTVLTCSCSASNYYWTSSVYQPFPEAKWIVDFGSGITTVSVGGDPTYRVRAVRGGM